MMEKIDEKSSIRSGHDLSISTAAAVISYSRIHMNKLYLYILNNGGKLYYTDTDTDSIVTDLKLPDNFVDNYKLDKLKLEHLIVKAYFVSDKSYAFIHNKGEMINRMKGIYRKNLSFKDYEKLYKRIWDIYLGK